MTYTRDAAGVEGPVVTRIGDLYAWERTASSIFVPVDVRAAGGSRFCAVSRVHTSAGIVACDLSAETAHTVTGSAGNADTTLCKLSMQLAGRSVFTQQDREIVLHEGQFVVYDTDVPYTLENAADMRTLILLFPRRMIETDGIDIGGARGLRFSEKEGRGRLAGPLLREVADHLELLQGPLGLRTTRIVLDTVAGVLLEALGPDTRSPARSLFAWIDDHLHEPDLSPRRIAAAHYMSTRRLHGLFHDEGTTVSAWVRQRRLEACRRDLEDPRLADRPIAALARRWGFPDPPHFSRTFRQAYGVTPSAYREAQRDAARTQPAARSALAD